MQNIRLTATAATHQVYRGLLLAAGRAERPGVVGAGESPERDRGAVSLEQVLWFVAAGIMVAVIAGILWQQIQDEANKPVTPPSQP